MNTQKHLEKIVRDLRSLANRLEYELSYADNASQQSKVEEFLRDIPQTVANLELNLLVRRLMREQSRAIISQEIDVVGPGATVVGAKIDRIG